MRSIVVTDIKKDDTPPKRSDWWVTENIRTTPERTAAVDQLIEMHTYKRVAWSKSERKFIHEFIKPIKGIKFDKFGNMSVRVGNSPIMWSSHTDTVHEKKGRQRVGFDDKEIGIASEDDSGSTCFGADDTVGVWHMLQMLDAGVPGLYVFHREEEGGRKGSKWIVENDKELLKDIKFAVALDRKNHDNFITHQMGDRCCSEDFANQFIALLNAGGTLSYKSDTTGSYTDTASYVDHIGECTNLSVGYTGAHSKWERLDIEHCFKLRDVLCSPEFIAGLKGLDMKRQPGEKEVKKAYSYNGHNYGGGGGSYYNSANKRSYGGNAWTAEEREFWDEWGYRDETRHSAYNGLPLRENKGTQSGTQVGTGVSKIGDIRRIGGNEANPDGKPVIMLPDLRKDPPKPDTAVVPPADDDSEHDTNYERLIQLIQRNPEATLEMMSTIIDESPETIADILDAEGMSEKKFIDEIVQMYGVCNC
jgi:hypothetical protein